VLAGRYLKWGPSEYETDKQRGANVVAVVVTVAPTVQKSQKLKALFHSVCPVGRFPEFARSSFW
jgi:hypothetical protein